MKNKGNTLGIVIVVLAAIAVLWFLTSGKALVVSKPAPNTITAGAINTYDPMKPELYATATTTRTTYPSYPSYPGAGKLAYVSYPISSSSSSSNYNYSSYYPSYPSTTYPTYPAYPTTPNYGQCYVGGCSSQLCTDQPGAVSTCEYRAEYSCYQRARCERQTNGACGWTPTNELYACLNSAR